MSKPLTEQERQRMREELSRKLAKEQRLKEVTGGKTGLGARWEMWKRAKVETTKKNHPLLAGTGTFLKWTVGMPLVGLWKGAKWALPRMYTRKDKDGHRHIAPVRSVAWTVSLGLSWALRTYLAMGAYYYGTFRTADIYVPNAGIFLNQQAEHPNEPGRIVTPRDQIYTVHGSVLEKNGKLEDYYANVEANLYFFWENATWENPGSVASHMTPQSEHGAFCHIHETGGSLPFGNIRVIKSLMKGARNWYGIQAEILSASCQQLPGLPPQFRQTDAPGFKKETAPATSPKPATTVSPTPEAPKKPEASTSPAAKPLAPAPGKQP